MRVILGVLDVAYSDANSGKGVTTTGDVAIILESQYHVMGTFVESHKPEIAGVLADSVAAAIQNVIDGAPSGTDPTFEGTQKIETLFRQFLTADEMSVIFQRFAGAPLSAAAAAGVSNRRKAPKAKRAPRPAFIDTGLYLASFRAWTEK